MSTKLAQSYLIIRKKISIKKKFLLKLRIFKGKKFLKKVKKLFFCLFSAKKLTKSYKLKHDC